MYQSFLKKKKHCINPEVDLLPLYLCIFSGTEALPPSWAKCNGVHQSNPDPQNQSWARLCTEGTDQRTGKF